MQGGCLSMRRLLVRLLLCCLLISSEAVAQAIPPSGRWEVTIQVGDLKVPFSLQLDLNPDGVSGTFVNGNERVSSTQGTLRDGTLRLEFRQYGTALEAKLGKDQLKGTYGGTQFGSYAVEGSVYCTCAAVGEAGPDISGDWQLTELNAPVPESAQLLVRRKGDDTLVHLFHPLDSHGEFIGLFDGLSFLLHHFDGARASLMELEPRSDGSLDVTLREPHTSVRRFHGVPAAGRKGVKAEARSPLH